LSTQRQAKIMQLIIWHDFQGSPVQSKYKFRMSNIEMMIFINKNVKSCIITNIKSANKHNTFQWKKIKFHHMISNLRIHCNTSTLYTTNDVKLTTYRINPSSFLWNPCFFIEFWPHIFNLMFCRFGNNFIDNKSL
jgi:hypothetical protein